MNTLVVYDSQYGNTEQIARRIAETCAQYGKARAERVRELKPDGLDGFDLLIIGCPTQGWRPTPVIKDFLAKLPPETLGHVFVAEFDTRFDKPRWLTGSAARGIAKQLNLRGAEMLVPPESFLVEGTEGPLAPGELEHAAEWANHIHEEFEHNMAAA